MRTLKRWWTRHFPPTPDRKDPADWTSDDRDYMFGGEHLF